ncbi:MAG: class I SAM-dependent methyltransferase [Endomicrobium sp.]|jgi:SAM-dependent methyltransferase|nr:class I SAM-dependent methyltransferase [Endomicrobium sp.]
MYKKSRFITVDDNKTNYFMYKLPVTWWSRPYEYEWCKNFIDKNDIVLDAASGIIHPLIFYLADNCKEVFACDLNKDITTDISKLQLPKDIIASKYTKIRNTCCSITKTPYRDNMFDKIFCISTLEHIEGYLIKIIRHLRLNRYFTGILKRSKYKSILKALLEFQRLLKPKGLLILTFDYPDIDLIYLLNILKKTKLSLVGDITKEIPSNALKNNDLTLLCFRMALYKNF